MAGLEPAPTRLLAFGLHHLAVYIDSTWRDLVSMGGFEPPTSCSQSKRSAGLTYTESWVVDTCSRILNDQPLETGSL